ncbi:hypothetical protein IH992_03520 [Candidatus Poribacteria bacterium]|nr:hypothetical protein [Candidatus Poribacteria bacterium]
MTLNQIRQIGIEALADKLGPVGMVRFLQQFETGKGNYSVDRHEWLTVPNVETLVKQIRQKREVNSNPS